MAKVKPLAAFTRLDFETSKRMKYRRILPYICEIVIRQPSSQKFRILKKSAGINVPLR